MNNEESLDTYHLELTLEDGTVLEIPLDKKYKDLKAKDIKSVNVIKYGLAYKNENDIQR